MLPTLCRRTAYRAGLTLLGAALAVGCRGERRSAPPMRGLVVPVRVANSPGSAELTGVSDLDVDSRGNVYVGDQSGQLFVFSPTGAVLRRLGRKGQGPGEFDNIAGVHVLPGDSIYTFDSSLQRGTVFGPGSPRPAYLVSLGTSAMLFPYWALPSSSTRSIFAAYRAAFGPEDGRGATGHRKEVLRILGPDGSVQRDSVVVFNEAEMLFLHGAVEGLSWNPFGRYPVFRLGPDGYVYAAWNGSLEISVYTADGKRVRTIRPQIQPAPRPITGRDRDSVVQSLRKNVPPAEVRRAFAAINSDSWPLFREMVVDDAQNVWLGLLGQRGEPVHWTAFDQDGAQVARMDLPENVSLRVVRGGRAYGVELDEDDVPRLVVYELRPATPAKPANGNAPARSS